MRFWLSRDGLCLCAFCAAAHIADAHATRECLICITIYNVFYVLRTVRRAAEGEPPRLEGGVPVHRKTFILVASTVSHSPAFPR